MNDNLPPGVTENTINKQFGDAAYERFLAHIQDWQEDYFGEYLEHDTYAYATMLGLLAKPLADTMPADPLELDRDRFLVLLDLAKSQVDFWGKFLEWAYSRYNHSC